MSKTVAYDYNIILRLTINILLHNIHTLHRQPHRVISKSRGTNCEN